MKSKLFKRLGTGGSTLSQHKGREDQNLVNFKDYADVIAKLVAILNANGNKEALLIESAQEIVTNKA